MNEFIIWDKKLKCFVKEQEDYNKLEAKWNEVNNSNWDFNNPYTGDELYPVCEMDFIYSGVSENFDYFNYISKTDIEGNKIYADSSILRIPHFVDEDKKQHYVYRKITWSEKYSAWIAKTLDDENEWMYFVLEKNAEEIRIIDTLQENKLGLIGDKIG